mmetsp:Transcript_10577/g.13042  ORF Transcript_10577/g.13042 Transcript_10577/m.13042 type:complete len:268 (+) Transcript_10577:111-914(+)|eukprot:CAMPEP_0172511046 /NCGR_PEP_ID=MMETSP1066-20121228/233454_1 /TAXON_ID=671091 /ORGANISM="Coscinodiscus wailesii, Strain CCMP2513" /LENGTH=267 /DNA_ID=CAMNT_0013290267 /DNA_START=109 /DNA_END=912 /DNA_ORIENTATION=-
MAPTELFASSDKSAPLKALDVETPAEKHPIMAYVVAPATLPEGYTFEAQITGKHDKTFTVVVPKGGVTEGQEFLAPLPHDFDVPRLNVPTGHWKDNLCGFCKHGPFHPHFCCALMCTQLAMAQVMKRMHLTWLGAPGTEISTKNTYKIVLALVISYMVYEMALEIAAPSPTFDGDPTVPPVIALLKSLGTIFFTIYAIYSLMKTRQSVRERYSIPETRLHGCEDLACSCFCSCCVAAQMMRHTGEYETYQSRCCTETGLPQDAPECV